MGCFYRPKTKFGARLYVYRCVSVHRGVPDPGGRRFLVPEGVGYLVLGGAWSWGLPDPGGGGCAWSRGARSWEVPGPRGPGPGWNAWSRGVSGTGRCLVETPTDGYCYGRYASYWNAFLFCIFSFPFFLHNACIPTVEPCCGSSCGFLGAVCQ